MIWLHRQRFEVRCVRLPPDTSLADLLARPSVGENLWRRFSFGAAYEALRAGVEQMRGKLRAATALAVLATAKIGVGLSPGAMPVA